MPRLQDDMVAVLRHAGRRQNTEENYVREMRRFLRWLGHNKPLKVRRPEVVVYLEHLGKRSVPSRKMAHAALRFFYVHVVNRPEVMAGIPWPRRKRSLRIGPCWADVAKLLDEVTHPVCRAVILVIVAAGLRISEACSLRVEDVQTERDQTGRKLDHGVLFVRDGKGGKTRFAPLSPTLTLELRRYYAAERPQVHLFPNQLRTGHITHKTVRRELRKACVRAGFEKIVTPHELRHTFGTTMLERGADLPTLQVVMGHDRLSTTSRYTHVRRDRIAAMPDLLEPPQRI